jgi:hypothetical protein
MSQKTTCPINDDTDIDYQLTAERYVKGGCLIVKNAEFGDYIVASVYDKDSVILEQYRATLCENWPVVSTYVEKEFIEYKGETYTVHKLNTAPLSAKISAGLYLRVGYNATDSGSAREVLLNYDMTKALS